MKIIIKMYVLGFMFLLTCCSSVNEITTFTDLRKNLGDKIQIVSRDSSVYYADSFSYTDTSITISGNKKKFDVETDFNDELFFKDISYIQTNETYFFPTAAFVGLNLFLIGSGIDLMGASSGIDVIVKYVTYGGGSCPYIYSWDGNKYILEGESFGTALGKSMEIETDIVLKKLDLEKSNLKIKISNERPETHFFNKIKLEAIETNENEFVYSNNHNSVTIITEHKNTFKAWDRNKTNITNFLTDNDDNYLISDLSSATLKSEFEDQIFVELEDVNQIDSLSLVISAINTEIFNVVFSYLQQLLGEEYVNFIKACETDQEVIDILKKSLIRSSLKIDIWDGTDWKYIDYVIPEATNIKFQKLVRLPITKSDNNNVLLRLRALSDVWKIDALSYDDTPKRTFVKHQPKLVSYKSDVNNDLSFVATKDDQYTKLLPGQSIWLEYKNIPKPFGKKISYNINIGGYLYEWIIDSSKNPSEGLSNYDSNTPKILFAKGILKNIDSILPLIYNNWGKIREKYALNEI